MVPRRFILIAKVKLPVEKGGHLRNSDSLSSWLQANSQTFSRSFKFASSLTRGGLPIMPFGPYCIQSVLLHAGRQQLIAGVRILQKDASSTVSFQMSSENSLKVIRLKQAWSKMFSLFRQVSEILVNAAIFLR